MVGTMPSETVGAIVDRLRAGESATSIATAAGVSKETVYRYGAAAGFTFDRRRPRPGRRRTAAVEAVEAVDWSPDCMSDEEWADWRRLNPVYRNDATSRVPKTDMAARPCADCPLGYAAEMRALGRCNGTPAGVQDDEEEPAMQQHASTPDASTTQAPGRPVFTPLVRAGRTTELPVALDLPCPACIHREVCRIREGLEARLAKLPVLVPELDPALSVAVEAKIECSLFRPAPRPKRQLSPEGKAALQQTAALMRDRKAAKAAAPE